MVQRTLEETLCSLERDQDTRRTLVSEFSVVRTATGRTVIRLELVTAKQDGQVWPVKVEACDVAVQTLQTKETASATDDLDAVDGVPGKSNGSAPVLHSAADSPMSNRGSATIATNHAQSATTAPNHAHPATATANHVQSATTATNHAPSPAQRLRSRDDSQKRHSLGNISPKEPTRKQVSPDLNHAHTPPNHGHASANHGPATSKHSSSFTLPWKRGAAAISKSRDSSKDGHRQPQTQQHPVSKDISKSAKPEIAPVVAVEDDGGQQAEGQSILRRVIHISALNNSKQLF